MYKCRLANYTWLHNHIKSERIHRFNQRPPLFVWQAKYLSHKRQMMEFRKLSVSCLKNVHSSFTLDSWMVEVNDFDCSRQNKALLEKLWNLSGLIPQVAWNFESGFTCT